MAIIHIPSPGLSVSWVTAKSNMIMKMTVTIKQLERVPYAASFSLKRASHMSSLQANFRRTNVVTKLKVTYIREGFLDVSNFWKLLN